jgi:diguanylate cyclase (GGDEF)-like protein
MVLTKQIEALGGVDRVQRNQLVRNVVQTLAADLPVGEVWPRCCGALSLLAGAQQVTVALRERDEVRAHLWDRAEPDAFVATTLEPGAVATEVLVTGSTIVQGTVVGLPIRSGKHVFGVISFEAASACDPELLTLLESCAMFAGARLSREELSQRAARYEQLAFVDGLTGIANRRRFDELLVTEWKRAARERTSLAVLMIDVDYFKAFNDNYGHQAGDLCLQQIARAVQSALKRPADACARYGGEEFVVLLPGTDQNDAVMVGERVLDGIAELRIPHAGSSLGRLSLSIGAASVIPAPATDPDPLLRAADVSLYEAKSAGRNRVAAAGYVVDIAPASPSETAPPNNLPLQLTRLVGRKHEIETITTLVAAHSLVTVVGTGGAGKTRVALQVAAEVASERADGVWFVDLAPIVDGATIVSTIGALFSAQLSGDEDALPALARILETRTLLLVLDNCEHLVQPVGEIVTALLHACPHLQVLATSRVPLEVRDEMVYRLPLLSLPSVSTGSIDAATALTYDSVALFVERGQAARQSFTLTDENASAVVDICRQLDGIALAIELAAARMSVIGVPALAEGLTQRLRILTGGDRTAPPRRQTLRSLIDWSHELLTEEERLLFARVGVFAGGWTLQAARDVCSSAALEADRVASVLSGLVRHSLLQSDVIEGSIRYRFLESIREYAREKLTQSGEANMLARRHAEHFLAAARDQAEQCPRVSLREWYLRRGPELENFRAALHWALTQGGDIVLGAELAVLLRQFFHQFSCQEARRWLQQAVDLIPAGAPSEIEARLWLQLAFERGTPSEDRAAAERAIELYRALDDPLNLARALRLSAETLAWHFPGEWDVADARACESIEIARRQGDLLQVSIGLQARCELNDWDVARKRAIYEEGLVLGRVLGNDQFMCITFQRLSELEFCAGNLTRALSTGYEALRCAHAAGTLRLMLTTEASLAHFAAAARDRQLLVSVSQTLVRRSRETGSAAGITWAVEALAAYAIGSGESLGGAQLLGFCDARVGSLHDPRQIGTCQEKLYHEMLAQLREELSEGELAQALASGAQLSVDEAIAQAYALV